MGIIQAVYEKMRRRTFRDIFDVDPDNGSFLYRTDTCCDRHFALTREEQMIDETKCGEDGTVGKYGNLEWKREQFIIACSYMLRNNFDKKPGPFEDLDDFVSNYKHLLSDDLVERKDIYDRIKNR